MLGYLLRRVLAAIPVMGVVALFVFLLLRLTPGDPAAILAGDNATPEQLERIRTSLGLNEPLYTQFFTWIGKLLHGDLGVSLISNVPVLKMIGQRVEPSISIAVSTIILAIVVAVPLGVIAAWKHGTWIDRFVMGLSVIGFSVPVFVIGYVLIQVFAIELRWLPVQGFRSITAGFGPFIERIILPTCTLSFIYVALIARMTRAAMLDVLGGLCPHRPRQGHRRERRAAAPCAAQRRGARHHRDRNRFCAADIRRRRHRKRVQPARHRPPHRRCRTGARLSCHSGDDPFDVGHLCHRQPADRRRLHPARSQNSLLRSVLMAIETLPEPSIPITTPFRPGLGFLTATPIIAVATVCLSLVILSAILAPWLAPHDPLLLAPAQRLKPASAQFLLGTDAYGRDVLSRILYGGRISLLIGLGAAVFSIGIGLVIGLVSGFFKWIDAVMMRVMDGLMAIPSILLAIAVVSLSGASLMTVLVAITIPEIPRVARLVRSVVLSAREEPYVEAAISVGSSLPKIMWRHLMPNTIAPLIVQGTYVCASAVLTEAILSFLGAGISPETPTWGNIMAEGRTYFQIKPSLIFWPGLLLSIAILSVNLIGDAARDALDPRMKQREGGK
jgi:peptide/nickel transport system permease protein